jgi:hypothetical protein
MISVAPKKVHRCRRKYLTSPAIMDYPDKPGNDEQIWD